MKIFIATHAKMPFVDNNLLIPIQVNAGQSEPIAGIQYTDNNGQNISDKNPNFCELTALYWMWKNQKEEDILGLAHYRRYFNTYQNFLWKPHRNAKVYGNAPIIEKLNQNPEKSRANIQKWLAKADVLTPYPQFFKLQKEQKDKRANSLKDDYYKFHIPAHWDVMIDVLSEKYPEYQTSVKKYFLESNKIIGTNMMIAQYGWVNQYCEWLFDILFEVEKRIVIPQSDPYQKRVFGFMSERLMTLYLFHNQYKTKFLQRLEIEELF